MLDLYMANQSYETLTALAEELVGPILGREMSRVSVASRFRDAFGVDPTSELPSVAAKAVADTLGVDRRTPWCKLLELYVETELEPLSAGGAVLLVDYPVGGIEPCARVRPGTVGVLNRFELFVDGLELVHGYEDETDRKAMETRAREIDLFNEEQAVVLAAIDRGEVPSESVGLGIGIERLCMAGQGQPNIGTYRHSAEY